jgi:hypothetical protein
VRQRISGLEHSGARDFVVARIEVPCAQHVLGAPLGDLDGVGLLGDDCTSTPPIQHSNGLGMTSSLAADSSAASERVRAIVRETKRSQFAPVSLTIESEAPEAAQQRRGTGRASSRELESPAVPTLSEIFVAGTRSQGFPSKGSRRD